MENIVLHTKNRKNAIAHVQYVKKTQANRLAHKLLMMR